MAHHASRRRPHLKTSNLCRSCGQDFSSVAAFDRHRTGTHEYLFADGLRLDPPREDGRRCLAPEELLETGMEVYSKGRWRLVPSEAQRAFYAAAVHGQGTPSEVAYKQNSSVLSASAA
jgi:hypothetical protein